MEQLLKFIGKFFPQFQRELETYIARVGKFLFFHGFGEYWIWALAFGVVIALGVTIGLVFFLVRGKPRKRVTPRAIRREARRAEKQKNYVRAGELYEDAGKFSKAISMYLQGKAPERAAKVYLERLNDFDKAIATYLEYNLYEYAARAYAKEKRYIEAGQYYQKAGKGQIAAEMYEKAESFLQAAELYKSYGFTEPSARCYAKANRFKEAGELYYQHYQELRQSLGKQVGGEGAKKLEEVAKRAAYFLREAKEFKRSAEILYQAGMKKQSAEMYLQAQDKQKAADIFNEIGEKLRAADLIEEMGDKQQASSLRASYYHEKGMIREAIQHYEQAGEYLTAADLYSAQGELLKAGELYLKGGDSRAAAESFYAAGALEQAAQAYEFLGNYERALEIYEHMGNEAKLSELYEKLGDNYKAGLFYYKRGLTERAIGCLSRIDQKDPNYVEAIKLIADIYFQAGRYDLALQNYRLLSSKLPFNFENLDLYYRIALVYERANQLSYAHSIYQRIMMLNPHYQDVTLRAEGIRRRISSPSGVGPGSTDATMAGPQAVGGGSGFRYQIVKELGRGGMGVVYLAKDLNLGRMVAYKVLPAELKKHKEIVANFIREAKSLAQLSHPYIVAIYDAGEYQGNYYIVMEYVEGENLRDLLLKVHRIPLKTGIEIFKQLAQALDYAHSKKVIHRDIKTSNIMWTNNQSIKVMDFGLAKMLEEAKTGRTMVSGTPYYMSPEQTLGKPLDHRTDIYSAGVTMYELFTGKVPFSEGDIGYHHIHTPPRSPKEFIPGFSDELARIILKCMAKNPAQRYQSARELYLDLKALG